MPCPESLKDACSMETVVRELEEALKCQLETSSAPSASTLLRNVTFIEVNSVRPIDNKMLCCDFSSDGKLLATSGYDKKVVLWYTVNLKPKTTLEGHSSCIKDVRFSPSMPHLATSSFDRTISVWDVDNHPGILLRTFLGHSWAVDFHPNNNDIICLSDSDGKIRFWSIKYGSCVCVFKMQGIVNHVRFQPNHNKYLAATDHKVVSIFDVETQVCRLSLQGHTHPILSVSWAPNGEYLTSVSEDTIKVWSLISGECVHEMSCNGNRFYTCVFHPGYADILIIGRYQSLELWSMSENKTLTLMKAPDGMIVCLASSTVTGLVASVSQDNLLKLWK